MAKEKERKDVIVRIAGSGFMGDEGHGAAYERANGLFKGAHDVNFIVDGIYSLEKKDAQIAADRWGIRMATDNLSELVDGADMVDICVPNSLHLDVLKLALDAGVGIIQCEKPLAATYEQAKEMMNLVDGKKDITTMVDFCYRFAPAVQLAKKWIDEGRILVNKDTAAEFIAFFRQDWGMDPSIPQEGPGAWRFSGEYAGPGGVWDDLGSHALDLICCMLGTRVESVAADSRIVIGEREGADHAPAYAITAEDAVNLLVCLENGMHGLAKATRFDTGHKADLTAEINGMYGGVEWKLEDMQYLRHFAAKRMVNGELVKVPSEEKGWTRTHVTNPGHYVKGAEYMRPGLNYGYADMLGWMMVALANGITEKDGGKHPYATFKDAFEQACVTKAVLDSKANNMTSTKVVYKK